MTVNETLKIDNPIGNEFFRLVNILIQCKSISYLSFQSIFIKIYVDCNLGRDEIVLLSGQIGEFKLLQILNLSGNKIVLTTRKSYRHKKFVIIV